VSSSPKFVFSLKEIGEKTIYLVWIFYQFEKWIIVIYQTTYLSENSKASMGSTSESILHVAPHVKLKKNEGELYLMSERLGWMVGNKEIFSVSHKYCDIKSKHELLSYSMPLIIN